MLILAEIGDQAFRAFGFAGDAGVAAMQYQPVMRIPFEFLRYQLEQFFLNLQHRFAASNTSAVRHAKDVRIDRNGRLTEGGVKNDICGFSAYPRERFQLRACIRDLSPILGNQNLAGFDEVVRLAVIEPDRTNVIFESGFSEMQ